jgi:putative transposase
MPNYTRVRIPGGTYFFTVITLERRPLLTRHRTRHALRHAIEKTRLTHPFRINAWVLLPDHLHCLWTLPDGDEEFSTRWSMIKRFTTQQLSIYHEMAFKPNHSRTIRRESAFWQRRFWEHLICDDDDFRRHLDYIHWNPVKHGYVTSVSDWPHSTFHQWMARGTYPKDWGNSYKAPGKFDFGE